MTTYRRPTFVATAVLTTGVLASLAGNLQAINLDNAAPGVGAHISAVFWPVILFGTVELLIHTPWLANWRDRLTKASVVLLVAGVAAWVSYWHLANVLSHYGYDMASRYAGPLAIDAAMVLATLALNRVGHARRGQVANVQDIADVATGQQIVAIGRTVSNDQGELDMAKTTWKDTRVSLANVSQEIGRAQVENEADMWARLEQDFQDNPAPVSPAPIVRPEVPEVAPEPRTGKSRLSADDSEAARREALTDRQAGLMAGAISDRLADKYRVSARTIRRQAWWVPTMAGLDSQAG